MNFRKLKNGFEIVGQLYKARYNSETYPDAITIFCENMKFMRLPIISAFNKLEEDEILSNWKCDNIVEGDNEVIWTLTADSNLWNAHSFKWVFTHKGITFSHTVKGEGDLGRCRFFSIKSANSTANNLEIPSPVIFVKKMFKPSFAHLDENTSNIQKSHSLGIKYDLLQDGTRNSSIDSMDVFTPPMLCYCFSKKGAWASVGIGTPPGGLLFNSFEYVGQGFPDSGFYVNYLGYTKANGCYNSPICSIQFGYSKYEALEKHVEWLDENNL